MKKRVLIIALTLAILGCSGQSSKQAPEFGSGNVKVSVEQGSEWLHNFPIFWFIKKKNAPQIAIWAEDLEGNYISTIYVSKKLAKQSWTAAGGNRRKESLPCWSFAQGKQYADGLYLPTKNEPLPDAITGAMPKGSFTTNIQVDEDVKQFVIKCEFNYLRVNSPPLAAKMFYICAWEKVNTFISRIMFRCCCIILYVPPNTDVLFLVSR